MTLYTIRNWNELYENNRSRDLIVMKWVPIPTKQDGDGYTDLVSMQDGAGLYGCWIGIVVVAAKCKPRGTLIRETGEPHTAQSIARMSHLPAGLLARALVAAVTVKWLDAVPYEIPHECAVKLQPPAVSVLPFSSVPFSEGESPKGGIALRLKAEIGKHFNRGPNDHWTYEEERLLCESARRELAEAEWLEIIAFRRLASEHNEKLRATVRSLLENWQGELDRARNYKPQSNTKKPERDFSKF
jgi:hypothetical protein